PFVVYGTNPIVAYVASSLAAKALLVWRIPLADGSRVHLKPYLVEHLFAPLGSPLNASLYYAIAYMLLWWGLTAWLYRRRIFVNLCPPAAGAARPPHPPLAAPRRTARG